MDRQSEYLGLARRHVSEAVVRLVKQRARVFELCLLRAPNDEGERLLKLMEETFELMLHHERRLEAEFEGCNAMLRPSSQQSSLSSSKVPLASPSAGLVLTGINAAPRRKNRQATRNNRASE